MSGGFFRGTSAEQDTRFSNKTAKLLKTQKFAPELDQLVDMNKVKMDAIRPWIATRVTQLLGFEDEVLINFIYGLLEGKDVDGKQIQIQLTGFMEKNTGRFMRELWGHLTSAQNNISGIPQQFLDEKAEETRKKKAEDQRIVSEFRKKEEDKKVAEQERSKMQNVSSEVARMIVTGTVKSTPAGFSGDRSPDSIHGHVKNGSYSVLRRNGSGEVSPNASRHGKEKRQTVNLILSRSRSRSGSIASKSVSRSPRPSRHNVSRSVSRSPRRVRRSRSLPKRGRSPTIVRSPRRRRSPTYSRSPPRRRKSPIPWSPPRSRRRSPRYIRSPPRRRPRPSPSPRRRQAPSVSPRRHATLPSPRRRPSSQSPRRRPAPPKSPRQHQLISKSPKRHQGHSISPRRRPAASVSPRQRLALSSSPPRHEPSVSPPRHVVPSLSSQHLPDISSSPRQRLRPLFSSQQHSFPPQQPPLISTSPSRHVVRSMHSPSRPPARSLSPWQNRIASPSPSRSASPIQQRSPSFASPRNMRSFRKSPFPHDKSLSKAHLDVYNGIEHRSVSVEIQGKKRPRSPSRDSSISAEKRQDVVKRSSARVQISDPIKQEKLEGPYHLVSKSSDDARLRGNAENQKGTRDMYSDGEEDIFTVSPPSNVDERKAAKKRRKEEKRLRKEEKRKKREEKQRRKEERRAAKAAAKAIPSVTPPPDLEINRSARNDDFQLVEEAHKSEEDDMESEQRRIENELRKKALDSIRAKKAVTL